MGLKLDQQSIQCLTLFSRIANVRTKECFDYNNTKVFIVKRELLSKAVGEKGRNVKRLSNLLRTKVRIIPDSELADFIKDVIQPVKFKKILIENNMITIFAGQQAKASLIGRNKVRLEELANILKRQYGVKSLRIV
ncbi:NusA-like transcription termination signal-binding factor [Nanoarchaeota archaeon]